MKLKATFEKRDLQVGLSSEVPSFYDGPDQKYVLAERVSDMAGSFHIRFVQEKTQLELDITSAELSAIRNPDRLHCHMLVNQLPDSAIDEAVEELSEIRDHHVEIAKQLATLPAPTNSPLVAARLLDNKQQ